MKNIDTLSIQPSDALVVFSNDLHILNVNEEMCALSGYSKEDLLKMTVTDLSDAQEIQERPILVGQLSETKPILSNRMLKTKSGERIEMEVKVRKTGADEILCIATDLKQRVEEFNQKRISESIFRAAFEYSALGLALVTGDGHFIKVNKELCRIIGYSEEELLKLSFLDITHPEDLGKDIGFLESARRGETNYYRVEKRYLHKTGTSVWANVNISVVRDDQNKVVFFVSQIEDITEKKEAELNFRNLVEQTPVGVYIIQDEVFVFANPAFSRISGYTEAELINKMTVDEIIHPDDVFIATEKYFSFADPENTHFQYEVRVKRIDGKIIWVEVFASKTHYRGNPALIGTITDITERRESSDKVLREKNLLDTIISGLPGIFYLSDAEGKMQRWNKNLETVTGLSFDQLKDKQSTDLIPPDMVPKALEIRAEILKGHKEDMEIPVQKSDGSYCHYYFSMMRVSHENEMKLLGMGIDLTNQKEAQLALVMKNVETQKRVKELNCLYTLSEFANNPQKSMKDILKKCVEIIPSSYQFPELASCRITFDGAVYKSGNFSESRWKQETEIFASNIAVGKVEVYYSRETPSCNEGPFLIEERSLINSVSEVLASFSERRKAEKTLLISEEKYRYLFHNNPAVIIIWDPLTFVILEVNNQAITTYGFTREEFIGMSVFHYRPEEDHARIRELAGQMLSEESSRKRSTWCHMKKDGELMYMDITSHKIDYNGSGAVLSLGKDVSLQYKSEEQLKSTYEDIRRLNQHLQTAREEERALISREIHDELGQQLTGLKLNVAWLAKKIDPEQEMLLNKTAEIMDLIDGAIVAVRKISTELRPGILDDLGLVPALEWQSLEFEKRSGLTCEFEVGSWDCEPGKNPATAIFRIFQESLTNVMRHAEATKVEASISIDGDTVFLVIRDNGKGFKPDAIRDKKTLGLLGMKERAEMFGGQLKIESQVGQGTCIMLTIPVSKNQ